MEFVDGKTLKIDRIENELDRFVVDFAKILEKHAKYVIVSGYVAILLGRSRATEDIDILVEKMSREQFIILFSELMENGYYCFSANSGIGALDYLMDSTSIRFAKKGKIIPNAELKFIRTAFDELTLKNRIKAVMPFGKIFISELETQIAFKRCVLKSEKDIEDALHMEEVFKSRIDKNKVERYKKMLDGYYDGKFRF